MTMTFRGQRRSTRQKNQRGPSKAGPDFRLTTRTHAAKNETVWFLEEKLSVWQLHRLLWRCAGEEHRGRAPIHSWKNLLPAMRGGGGIYQQMSNQTMFTAMLHFSKNIPSVFNSLNSRLDLFLTYGSKNPNPDRFIHPPNLHSCGPSWPRIRTQADRFITTRFIKEKCCV